MSEEKSGIIVEGDDATVAREVRRLTRRNFVIGGAAAAAGFAAWKWIGHQPLVGNLQLPLRKALHVNENLASAYFSEARLAPTFAPGEITKPRVNGHIGLQPDADVSQWKLKFEGLAGNASSEVGIEEIRSFPVREMITEFKCIEGWSTVNRWTGVRLADVMAKYRPASRDGGAADLANPASLPRYVAMETAGRLYYVGLDMQSAMHPQTLLAWELNGKALDWHHGAPLRLVIPVKYGIKNIKRIATIRFTDVRPGDFWADRGYDWYAGH